MERSTAEIIVKVYAVLSWIGAVLGLIGGLGVLFLGSVGSMALMPGMDSMMYGGTFAGLALVAAVVILILAIVQALVGFGLWKYRNWARVTAIVLSVINLFSFPIGTIIGAFGIYFFGFDQTAKGLFSGAVSFAAVKETASEVKQTATATTKPKSAPKKK